MVDVMREGKAHYWGEIVIKSGPPICKVSSRKCLYTDIYYKRIQ